MKFTKTIEWNNIVQAFADFPTPCHNQRECSEECPFYYIMKAFDTTCAGFCFDYPIPAARLMDLEIKE